MKTRNEMSQHCSAEVPLTFWDVAARFSEQEWTLLHHWQRELYKNVMKEINQALNSLGPLIAISVFSLRPKDKNDLCLKDLQVLEQEKSVKNSSRDANTEVDVLLIEKQNPEDTCDKYIKEIGDGPSTATRVLHSDNILKVEEELESGLRHVDAVQGEESSIGRTLGQSHSAPVASFTIKKEAQAFPINRMDSESRESIASATGLAVVPPGPDVTTPGSDVTMPVISIVIKEEQETDLIGIQGYHRRECFYSPAGNGGMKRRASSLIKCNDKSPLSYSVAKKLKANTVQSIHGRNIQMWSGRDGELTDERTAHSKIECGQLRHSTLPMIPYVQSSKTYIKGNSTEINDINIAYKPNPLQSSRAYTCPTSEQTCQNDSDIGHQQPQKVNRRYPCKECGKSFTVMSNLLIHERIHTGERPHHCTLCGKSFTQKGVLLRHQKMHTGERPYQCNVCGKSFNQKHHLLRHQKTHSKTEQHFPSGLYGLCNY